MFGHEETSCRKKGSMRKEWRPVQPITHTEEAISHTTPQPMGPVDEFTPITRRATAIHAPNTTPYESPKQTNIIDIKL